MMRSVPTKRPCLGFKIMAASRNCTTPESTRRALQFGYDNIKPTDAIVVGMFPKHRDQPEENARFVREILQGKNREVHEEHEKEPVAALGF